MEKLEKLTPIELLTLGNKIKAEHDALKKEVIDITYEIEDLEKRMNFKSDVLQKLEKDYVEIIEFIEKEK